MAEVVEVLDRAPIERFARRDLPLHIYQVGDLDPFYWPSTRWYGLPGADGELRALALLYAAPDGPVLLALGRDDGGALHELVDNVADRLPTSFYSHLSPGLAERFTPRWALTHHGRYLKMLLSQPDKLTGVDSTAVVPLSERDLPDITALYERAYPGNWFDARMLQTGQYYGVHAEDRLICVAGIHVYSPRYGVAALGNITTDPEHRGRGLARATTAELCRSLHEHVGTVGLNVRADNAAAIACYEGLGFETVAEYDEFMADPPG